MTAQPDITAQRKAQVAQLRELASEITFAISALEKNDLVGFASHVTAQEVICDRLGPALSQFSSGDWKRSESMNEMQEANAALARIGKVYAAVLKRAGRTSSLIGTLYRTYAEGYEPKPSCVTKRQTWSCEV